jgi:hypothetical protein
VSCQLLLVQWKFLCSSSRMLLKGLRLLKSVGGDSSISMAEIDFIDTPDCLSLPMNYQYYQTNPGDRHWSLDCSLDSAVEKVHGP